MTNNRNSNEWIKLVLEKLQGGTRTQAEVVQFVYMLG